MMPGESPARYALNRVSLGYKDPNLEAEYQSYQPAMLMRILRPVVLALIPLTAIIGVMDYWSLFDLSLVPWWASLVLLISLTCLLALISSPAGLRFVQLALLVTTVLFGCALLVNVSSAATLAHYFPGYFIAIMMCHLIGLRFTYGLTAAVTLILMLIATAIINRIGVIPLMETGIFLVPGYAIAATAGYTIERQRRHLFAQLKQLEHERGLHERMALHDPLTNLPNRNLLQERMLQALARAKRRHGQFAVLFVDLDEFKTVNDSYGHGIGDEVLKHIAVNLQHQIRGEDTVARLGGDEFVVLSEHVDDERSARTAANRIHAAVSKPIVVNTPHRGDTIHVHVTCSIGICLCPRDGDTLDQLVSRADEAMYAAKRNGKGFSRFFRSAGDGSRDAEQTAS